MKYRRINDDPLRPLLSEVTPYEMPIPISMKSFYRTLKSLNFEWTGTKQFRISAKKYLSSDENYLKIIFGDSLQCTDNDSKFRNYKFKDAMVNPYLFKVKKNYGGYRLLSLMHPLSMLQVSKFIYDNSENILYSTNLSDFSLRYPTKVARTKKINSFVRYARPDDPNNLEMIQNETEYIQSYFAYSRFNMLYKYFESSDYRKCERLYNYVAKIDVSHCFPSIYTHSISWATNGWIPSKINLKDGNLSNTFGNKFDSLMQSVNYKETNGIITGPEVSRIFAEIILQRVDNDVQECLKTDGNIFYGEDYVISRFLDDYIIFSNREEDLAGIIEVIENKLSSYKLYINSSKTIISRTPLPDEITYIKNKFKELFRECIVAKFLKDDTGDLEFKIFINESKIISEIKSIFKSDHSSIFSLNNYLLGSINKKISRLYWEAKEYDEKIKNFGRHAREVYTLLVSLLEISAYLHSLTKTYSHSFKFIKIVVDSCEMLKLFGEDNLYLIDYKKRATSLVEDSLGQKGDLVINLDAQKLLLIDCLTYLNCILFSSSEIEKIELDESWQNSFDLNSILVLLRNSLSSKNSSNYLEFVLKCSKAVIDKRSDPRYETQSVWLRLALLDARDIINKYSIGYSINLDGIVSVAKNSSKPVSGFRSNRKYVFDAQINDNYSYLLALKGSSAVY